MDILLYILAGASVGFIIGITGIGGGALMTPLLLLFNFPANIAIGTDLLYAAGTKTSGAWAHQRKGNINWDIAFKLLMGSIPASLVTGIVLKLYFNDASHYSTVLSSSLGIMLILTALVLIFRSYLHSQATTKERSSRWVDSLPKTPIIISMGVFLGVFVTLSSVGAGAIGTAILLILYPALSAVRVVGTDLAHAVPLTLVGGIVHLFLGNIDFYLLACLLIGSIPAINLGARVGTKLPDKIMHPLLASTLLALGCKYALF